MKGEPVAKGRARVTSNGTYTPKKTKDYQKLVGYSYKGPNFGEKPLQVDIKAYYSHTKTTQLRKGELALLLKNNGLSDKGLKRDLWQRVCKNTLIPATVKPDGDNVAKSVLDALNGIAYDDDSQCIDIRIRKYRSFDPRVEVEIKEVVNETPQNKYL